MWSVAERLVFQLWLGLSGAVLLFFVGLRLSAFFSGAETGFYRLSLPRLSIDARAGDQRADALLWFAQNPAYFVATCLIGNNVANYLTTAAIGWASGLLLTRTTTATDIGVTLLMSPIIFQFGELLPKTVYYLTPVERLRHDVGWFIGFFRSFFIFSYPLVVITRIIERFSGQIPHTAEAVLGRSRLVQLMQHGQEEGVLTNVQSVLANGLLQLAPEPVTASMTPVDRIWGLPENASTEEFLKMAKDDGRSCILVHRADDPAEWYGYVHVIDVIARPRRRPLINPMSIIPAHSSKLVALHQLQCDQSMYGLVRKEDQILGIIARNGLIGQIYRSQSSTEQGH